MLARRRFLLPLRHSVPPPPSSKAEFGGGFVERYNLFMKTVYTFVSSPNHVYPDHPERPARFDILKPRLKLFDAELIEAKPATPEEITYVHNPKLVAVLEKVCREQAPGIIDYAPTYVTRSTFEDALLAAGGVITCARAVINGDAKNEFAIIRPPGHHAEPERAMGFCIFNNIAIVAQRALDEHGAKRLLVLDWDVHHGNGTNDIFYATDSVLYASIHQSPLYPGTGALSESGAGAGEGYTVNLPVPA